MEDITPYVSVVMPVHNGQDTIKRALMSILEQTLLQIEVIIIDDASTDNTNQVITAIKDERVFLLKNNKKSGISFSLNLGIDAARGKYIARMDADDISYPVRLEKQFDFLEENAEISICGTFIRGIKDSGETQIYTYYTKDCDIKTHLLFFCPFAHPTVMWRKKDFDNYALKYDPYFKKAQDYDLWERASGFLKMANLSEVLLDYQEPQVKGDHYIIDQGKYARLVRRRQCKRMRINCNHEEEEIHEYLAYSQNTSLHSRLRETKEWIHLLVRANEQSGFFNHRSLKKLISLKYYSLIKTYPSGKWEKLRNYLSLGFWGSYEFYLFILRLLIVWR